MGYITNSNGEKVELTKAFVELKAVEFKNIKSMWSGFMGAANAGMNSITNKLNALFNSGVSGGNQYQVDTDYNSPFKPIEIDTGLSVILEEGEVFQIHTPAENANKGLVLACGNLITESGQIKLYFYNMFPSEVQIQKDDILALGIFVTVKSQGIKYNGWNVTFKDNEKNITNTPRVDLTKD